jgi:hypothetical protein
VYACTGASITLIGAKTTVHHNCTRENSDVYYGLQVCGSSSTIQLIPPLTKEELSFDNGGGHNWGAEGGADIYQIKTMTEAEVAAAAKYRAKATERANAALSDDEY